MKTSELRMEHIISAIKSAAADDWGVSIQERENDKLSELAKSLNALFSGMRSRIENTEKCIENLVRINMHMALIDTVVRGIKEADDRWRYSGNIHQLYRDILKNLMEVTAVDYGTIAIFDREGKVKDFMSYGFSEAEEEFINRPPLGKGLLGECYREDQVTRINNLATKPQPFDLPAGYPVMEGVLGAPIKVSGSMRGVVCLANRPGGSAFSENDERIMDKLAREVATILERNELLEAVHESNQVLQRDIEERTKIQENLAKTGGRLQYLVDNTPAIIYTSVPSGDFKITFVSENLTRVLGYEPEELLNENDFWLNHIHPDDVSGIFSTLPYLFVEGQQAYEYRFRHKDSSYVWVHDTLRLVRDSAGGALEIIGSMTDITQRKQIEHALQEEKEQQKSLIKQLQEAQSQLLQSEKMASIGQLAAGVAHEINNPVGYVSSNLGSLQKYIEDLFQVVHMYEATEHFIEPDKPSWEKIQSLKKQVDIKFLETDIAELIKESLGGVRRVREIVQDLKDFSHVDEAEWQVVDLHKGLDSTLNIAHNEIKYKANVIKEYGSIPLVECLASQLNQVFMNLLVNAAQSIESQGIITIRTGMKDDWVWVEVSDNGKGIPAENMNRIFEPFFTTKPVGKGTGLGLSLSYGILKKHGGHCEVQSEIGKGTSFKVWLPVSQSKNQSHAMPHENAA